VSGSVSDRGTVIIAVGDEILGGFIQDTNSAWLAERVRQAGYPAKRIEVVPDEQGAIVDAVRRAIADPSVARVMVCGGVGPTPDDRTLEAVAVALGRPLLEHPDALRHIEGIISRMAAAGWVASTDISEANRRMTVVPEGAMVLFNRRGMAPGLAYPLPTATKPTSGAPAGEAGDDRWLFVLPGVPRELTAIAAEEIIPRYFADGTADHIAELHYRYAVEAEFSQPMCVLAGEYPGVSVGSYPQTETRELIIRLRGGDAEQVNAAAQRLRELRPPSPSPGLAG
jgi:molybdenum cofactor synthesis domain-containing protein